MGPGQAALRGRLGDVDDDWGLYRLIDTPLSTGDVMHLHRSLSWDLGLPTERSRAALFRSIRGETLRGFLGSSEASTSSARGDACRDELAEA